MQNRLRRTEDLKEELAEVITRLDAGVTLGLRRREILREMRIGRGRLEFFAAKARTLRLKKRFYRLRELEEGPVPEEGWVRRLEGLEEELDRDFAPFYKKLHRMEEIHRRTLASAERIQGGEDPAELQAAYRGLVRAFHPLVEPVRGRDCRPLWEKADRALLEGDVRRLAELREGPDSCGAAAGFSLGWEELETEALRLEGLIREKGKLLRRRQQRLDWLTGRTGEPGEAEWLARMSRRLRDGRAEWEEAEHFYREKNAGVLYRLDPSLAYRTLLGGAPL